MFRLLYFPCSYMNKILIAGGAGFLGTNLIEKLIEDKNNSIICLDNFYTGKRKNIEQFSKEENFQLIEQDVMDPIDLDCNQIYNLACPATPPHYQKDPIYTFKTNILGILNLLELAKESGAFILQASTSEIYGDPKVHPQTEDYQGSVSTTGIRACYDEGKRAAETACFDYHRQFGTHIKIMRIFSAYGPNMDSQDGRVVSKFIMQALKGEDITIYGDGSQTRSFCFVDDLIVGMVKLMNSKIGFTGPVNIGNPHEFTMLELAKKVIEITKTKSKIIHQPLPQDDPLQRKPDISLAKRELDWEPKVHLDMGLKKSIEFFK